MTGGAGLALAIALPIGVVVVIVLFLATAFVLARRRRRDRADQAQSKRNIQWNEDQDEVLDDREWVPLEAGWRDPSQSRLSTLSTHSAVSGSSGRLSNSHIDINNNGFAYRPPPPPPPPVAKLPMSERKKSGISSVNVPATIGERDENIKAVME